MTSSPLSAEKFREYFNLAAAFEILPLFLFPWNTKTFDCFWKSKIAEVSMFWLKPDVFFEKIFMFDISDSETRYLLSKTCVGCE